MFNLQVPTLNIITGHNFDSDNTASWNHDVSPESFLQDLSHFLMTFFCHTSNGFPHSASDTASQRHLLSPVSEEAANPSHVKSMDNRLLSTMTTWAKDGVRCRCNILHFLMFLLQNCASECVSYAPSPSCWAERNPGNVSESIEVEPSGNLSSIDHIIKHKAA